ncbi:transposase [Paludisphaera mucosa]|uniref:transposase n=1 Tax=Paludisphaera mucosa TaxID=3030827 RepID=UPI0034A3C3A8
MRRGDDDLACHDRQGAGKAIKGACCRLLRRPPYSPDFNPIEQTFAKLKRLFREADEITESAAASIPDSTGRSSAEGQHPQDFDRSVQPELPP